jgi:transketolase
MPSWELFEQTPREYKDRVLLPDVAVRLAIEAGSPMGWERYVGNSGAIIGIKDFGASAPGGTVMKKFGFTSENIVQKAMDLLKKWSVY